MATIAYRAPQLVGSGNIREPKLLPVTPAQGATWRRGDLVVQVTTGTIVNPPSVASGGNLATASPPAASAVTIANHAVSGAPAATYFIAVTYTATGQETLPYYTLYNCPAGNTPAITVASAGAPAGATNFAAYVGLIPGTQCLQQATKTTTALGSAFNVAYPLTNNIGAGEGATNLSANILGLALTDSNATYFDGVGGSFTAGNAGSRLGATNSIQPLTPSDAMQLYVATLGFGQLVEFNLNQNTALNQNLIGSTAGMTLDATTGFWTVDPTQSNKIFTISDFRQGVYIGPTASGSYGDLGARVIGYFNSGLLAQ